MNIKYIFDNFVSVWSKILVPLENFGIIQYNSTNASSSKLYHAKPKYLLKADLPSRRSRKNIDWKYIFWHSKKNLKKIRKPLFSYSITKKLSLTFFWGTLYVLLLRCANVWNKFMSIAMKYMSIMLNKKEFRSNKKLF